MTPYLGVKIVKGRGKKSLPFSGVPGHMYKRLLPVKCYDNKMVKLTFNLIILPLIKSQVANQQEIFDAMPSPRFEPQTSSCPFFCTER